MKKKIEQKFTEIDSMLSEQNIKLENFKVEKGAQNNELVASISRLVSAHFSGALSHQDKCVEANISSDVQVN